MIDSIMTFIIIFSLACVAAQLGISARKSIYSSRKVGKFDD